MKGTILGFLKLAAENDELARDLAALATKYDYEFSDELSDEDLDEVSGGAWVVFQSLEDRLKAAAAAATDSGSSIQFEVQGGAGHYSDSVEASSAVEKQSAALSDFVAKSTG